jgi:starch synthase
MSGGALPLDFPIVSQPPSGFDERLAHQIEAGADLFLMPSRYEPCGLNQMYSLRYGTLPIVRSTGGSGGYRQGRDRTRWKWLQIQGYSPADLVAAVRRALDLFGKAKEWRKIQQNGMKLDFSWDASARGVCQSV